MLKTAFIGAVLLAALCVLCGPAVVQLLTGIHRAFAVLLVGGAL